MAQLTTSKRISLMFTLYAIGIVFFFGIVINIVFFQQWYHTETLKVQDKQSFSVPSRGKRIPRFAPSPVENIPSTLAIAGELHDNTIMGHLAKVDDEYIVYGRVGDTFNVSVVTRLVEAQLQLIRLFLFLVVIFAILTYALSLFFVRSSLKNIKILVDYVTTLDMYSLHKPVPVDGPPDDEIRTIAETLQEALYTIKEQTDSLKDFVTHASHEIKTPLMGLSAAMDAALKTGKYNVYIPKLKSTLHTLNTLFDTLLAITQWEYHTIQKMSLDIAPLVRGIREELATVYIEKHIDCSFQLPAHKIVLSHPDICRIIFYNLIQNAYKYTPEGGKITIAVDDNTFTLADNGPGIDAADRPHIREKFRKNHHKKGSDQGFGLGLYLVQLLVKKQGWDIAVTDTPQTKTGSVFTLTFH